MIDFLQYASGFDAFLIVIGMLLAWGTICWVMDNQIYKTFMSDSYGRFLDAKGDRKKFIASGKK